MLQRIQIEDDQISAGNKILYVKKVNFQIKLDSLIANLES